MIYFKMLNVHKFILLNIFILFSIIVVADETTKNITILNKIGYGATDKSLEIIKKESRYNWLYNQLNFPNMYDDSNIENKYIFPNNDEELFHEYITQDFTLNGGKVDNSYFYGRNGIVSRNLLKRFDYALNSENRLREMLVWFWCNHFTIGVMTNTTSSMFANDFENKIRTKALGNFKDILTMVSHHPAMLYYLNNSENKLSINKNDYFGFNENYAREFLELHTMGVNSGYTQQDVKSLTRILTGFGLMMFLNYDTNKVKNINNYNEMIMLMKKENKEYIDKGQYIINDFFEYNGKYHDYTNKTFLNNSIKGTGYNELDKVIDIIIKQPATAHFISKKLAVYFMNDNPSEELIEKMAKVFLNTEGDIPKILNVLFTSEEFEKTLNLPTKIKDTYSYFLSTLKTGIKNTQELDSDYLFKIIGILTYIEADPYFKTTPEGLSIYGKDWLSSSRLQQEIYFTNILMNTHDSVLKDKYPINYKLLSEIANKDINTKEEATLFLTSENWLKK